MRLISFAQLATVKGIPWGRDHLRRKIKLGEFPQPILLSSKRIAWTEEAVDDWLAEKAAASKPE
jgi:predicted DNA-binding transcriptional regulator AlpA